jgi:hypothetical protein
MSLRTRAWFARQAPHEPPRLFVKPDDRWEVNEVADRRGDVVEEALRAMAAYREWMQAGGQSTPPSLSPLLLSPAE